MVKIRLQRTGTKADPHYRIVAADSKYPRDGRFIELLGSYHPAAKNDQILINEEKALAWLTKGAQPTGTVNDILRKKGILTKHKESLKSTAKS